LTGLEVLRGQGDGLVGLNADPIELSAGRAEQAPNGHLDR
jgi:hypothetical protein